MFDFRKINNTNDTLLQNKYFLHTFVPIDFIYSHNALCTSCLLSQSLLAIKETISVFIIYNQKNKRIKLIAQTQCPKNNYIKQITEAMASSEYRLFYFNDFLSKLLKTLV